MPSTTVSSAAAGALSSSAKGSSAIMSSTHSSTSGTAAVKPLPKYCEDLRADIRTAVGSSPHVRVHAVEWRKLMAAEPVEINPSIGQGFKVMTVEEWSARWKHNPDFPACLACGGTDTKEHYFTQTWCRGQRRWESETLCLGCLAFSFRAYTDPEFKTPEQHEKEYWTAVVTGRPAAGAAASLPGAK